MWEMVAREEQVASRAYAKDGWSNRTKALVATGLSIYTVGVLADWSQWVAIAIASAEQPHGDYFWSILSLLLGWIPAFFWPVHAMALAWNAGYCSMVFGALCHVLGMR